MVIWKYPHTQNTHTWSVTLCHRTLTPTPTEKILLFLPKVSQLLHSIYPMPINISQPYTLPYDTVPWYNISSMVQCTVGNLISLQVAWSCVWPSVYIPFGSVQGGNTSVLLKCLLTMLHATFNVDQTPITRFTRKLQSCSRQNNLLIMEDTEDKK